MRDRQRLEFWAIVIGGSLLTANAGLVNVVALNVFTVAGILTKKSSMTSF